VPRILRGRTGIGALSDDDQPDVRRLMCFLLEEGDGLFVSGEAGSGEEALAQLDDGDHAVVLLDHRLPGADGCEVAEEIRARRPDLRVILCSSFLDDEVRARAHAAGVAACLDKGEFDELPRVVREVVDGR
jgi:CheY-like chemotaxis protein